MDNGILYDVRTACGLNWDDNSFDNELIILTNTYLFRAAQIGVGKKGFSISGDEEQWSDFALDNFEDYESLKTYVGLSVRTKFDPPENGTVMAEMQNTIQEMEWCLYVEAEVDELGK